MSLLARAQAVVVLLGVFSGSALAADAHTVETNLEFRMSIGGLNAPLDITPIPSGSNRAVRLTGNTDELLKRCRADRKVWKTDPFWARLAHWSPQSTIGCREKVSPSLHVVFYKARDGSREAWAHFDTYGPRNPIFHAGEVFRNKLTLGRTSGYDVYRGLVRMKLRTHPEGEQIPPPRYDFQEHAREYMRRAFGPSALGFATASAAITLSVRNEVFPGSTTQTYWDRIQTNLVRNVVMQSAEFTASAFLQQDETFRPSNKSGFGPRMGAAFYNTFVVPGREGDELAMPRIAAAITTPWLLRPYHPGLAEPEDPWVQMGWMLGRYIMKSYWTEFKPDIEKGLRRMFGLRDR